MKLILSFNFFIGFFAIHSGFGKTFKEIQKNSEAIFLTKNFDSSYQYRQPSFFKELCNNIIIQTHAPFHIKQESSLKACAGVAITIGLIFLDQSIDNKVRYFNSRHKDIGTVSNYVTELGGNYGLGMSALFAGFSYLTHNKKGIQTSRLLAQSLITTTLWTRFGKSLTGRKRPFNFYGSSVTDKTKQWSGPFILLTEKGETMPGSSWDSFPSGHTSTAFAIATVFATQYKDQTVVPILSYTLASVVGLTRMTEHEHWASDVFVGACLGYLCAKQVCNNVLKEKMDKKELSFYADYLNNKFTAGCFISF